MEIERMRLRCNKCGKSVSIEVPDDTILRGWIECPECIEKQPDDNSDALIISFVQGAKWWECHQTGATMWQSDQHIAEKEAIRRSKNETLGKLIFNLDKEV
jgi:DNA-directed RNA polymerase subunit RPC12/RpoP